MPISLPELQPVELGELERSSPEQRAEDGLHQIPEPGILTERPWYASDFPPGGYIEEQHTGSDLPFVSPEAEKAEEKARRFVDVTQSIVHRSGLTDLVAYAFGNLWPSNPGASDEHAAAFLNEHALVFGGRESGIGQRRVRRTRWGDCSTVVEFQQVNQDEIPVLGARIVLTYDSGENLAFVNSSLLPATVDDLPRFPDATPGYERLYEAVEIALSKDPEFEGSVAGLQDVLYSDGPRPFEQWILPLIEERGFVPAYRVFFVDTYDHAWAFWLRAEDLSPLYAERRESEVQVLYGVYVRPSDVDHGLVKQRMLSFDGAADTLQEAARVRVMGERFYDVRAGQGPIGGNPVDSRNILAPNAFHHVWETQADFWGWMTEIDEDAVAPRQIKDHFFQNPIRDIAVQLEETEGGGMYHWDRRDLVLRTGVHGRPPVREPGFDGDVIAHEFTHAVLHFYHQPLFEDAGPDGLRRDAAVLDEALSFYFACVHFRDFRWGEYAYRDFSGHSFEQPIEHYDQVVAAANPQDGVYPYALWWARILWHLHVHPDLTYQRGGVQTSILPVLLLQVLRSFELVVPPTNNRRGVFNRIADQLYLKAQRGREQAAIAEIWAICGFTVP